MSATDTAPPIATVIHVMMLCLLLTRAAASTDSGGSDGKNCASVHVDADGNLHLAPSFNGRVLVNGMDVLAVLEDQQVVLDRLVMLTTDDCSPSPCKNGGTCTDGVNAYACECMAGYEGDDCNINTDDCSPSPCKNGGTCMDGVDAYTCKCAAGYEGEDCSINTDDCSPSPCKNGGTCMDGVDAYTCKCTAGYEGEDCSINTADTRMKSDYGAVLKVLNAGEDSVNGFYKSNGEYNGRPIYLMVRQGGHAACRSHGLTPYGTRLTQTAM